MSKKKTGSRVIIRLKSSESSHFYSTYKNKKNTTEKIEIKKFDPVIKKTVLYKESK